MSGKANFIGPYLGRQPRSGYLRNHRLPALYRVLAGPDEEGAALGELSRDAKLAAVEAALAAMEEDTMAESS